MELMTLLGTVQAEAAEKDAKAPATWRSAGWFFVCMASVLVVIVAVGFAPSFYLPSVIRPEQSAAGKYDFPAYIVLHGIVLTSWFLLLLTQAVLIATKRVHIHRSLGIAGVAIAAVLVPLSAFVVTRSVARSNLGGLAVIGDYGVLLLFTLLVSLPIRNRARPDVHKRTHANRVKQSRRTRDCALAGRRIRCALFHTCAAGDLVCGSDGA